jgi:hypothetical protein
MPPDRALTAFPAVALGAEDSEGFRRGQAISLSGATGLGLQRVYAADGQFLGVGECSQGGTLAPRRVFKTSEITS